MNKSDKTEDLSLKSDKPIKEEKVNLQKDSTSTDKKSEENIDSENKVVVVPAYKKIK